MSDTSKIEWTDATWSPVTGCTKVSAGCKHCYAEREVETRWSKNPKSVWFGRKFTDVQCHPDKLDQPLHWRKPRRIFVCPRADLFHEAVPDEYIAEVFAYMAYARQHTFQVLTKRSDRLQKLLTSEAFIEEYDSACSLAHVDACDILGRRGEFDPNERRRDDIRAFDPQLPLRNVWLGVSVEDQAAADERIPLLLETPAAVRWISAEPLIGPVSLRWIGGTAYRGLTAPGVSNEYDALRQLSWVVTGGESGSGARPSHPDWFRALRDQCAAASVPYFFKQWGEWRPTGSADWCRSKTAPEHAAFREKYSRAGYEYPGCPGLAMLGDGRACITDSADKRPTIIDNIALRQWLDAQSAEAADAMGYQWMYRVGKKAAGRRLDGIEHNEYPASPLTITKESP